MAGMAGPNLRMFCLMACVPVAVLWWRGQWWSDIIFRIDRSISTTLGSNGGRLYLIITRFPGIPFGQLPHNQVWTVHSGPRPPASPYQPKSGFEWRLNDFEFKVAVPCWFVNEILLTIATLPWSLQFPWHRLKPRRPATR